MFGDARGTLGLMARAAAGPGEALGPDLASEGSPSAGQLWPHKGKVTALRELTARTRGLCGLLLVTKAELKRTCE